MAHRFHSENEHCMPQSKLHRTDGVEAFDENLHMFTFGEIASAGSPQMPTTFDFSLPELATGIFGMDVPDVTPLENRRGMGWPNLDISDTLGSGFDTSIISDLCSTGDFDTPEMTIQVSQSTELSTYNPAGEKAMYHSNPAPHSLIETSVHSGKNAVYAGPMAIREDAIGYCDQAIKPKRKQHTCSGTHNDVDDRLIDKEHALRITLSVLPHPTICTIDYLARKFNVDTLVVMDLCSRSKGPPDSGPSDCNRSLRCTALCSDCREYESSDATERCISVHHAEINRPSITKKSTKRVRANIDGLQEAGKMPATQFHSCTKCSWSFKKRGDLRRHSRSHFPGHLRCHFAGCHKLFYRKDKLSDHIKNKHKNSTIELNAHQDEGKDSGDDQDDTQPSGKGSLNSAKPSRGAFGGGISGLVGFSGRTADGLNDDLNDGLMDAEFFYPSSQNEIAIDYMKAFSSARVIRKLGQGGFGQVYELSLADVYPSDYGPFACKIIKVPSQGGLQIIERARNEIKILQLLDHPNIVSFFGAFISTECAIVNTYPVAEYTLKGFLCQQSHPLTSLEKIQLWASAHGIASALSYLHKHGTGEVVHCDIKPENILAIKDTKGSSQIRLLLADFGSARLSTSTRKAWTSSQAITPRYCAPECLKDSNQGGPPSDIWSFGCILLEIFTHIHEKTMADFETFRVFHIGPGKYWNFHETLPIVEKWLKKVCEECDVAADGTACLQYTHLIMRMLSKNPVERPSANEVTAELRLTIGICEKVVGKTTNMSVELVERPQDKCQGISSQLHRIEQFDTRSDHLSPHLSKIKHTTAAKCYRRSAIKQGYHKTEDEITRFGFVSSPRYAATERVPGSRTVHFYHAGSLKVSGFEVVADLNTTLTTGKIITLMRNKPATEGDDLNQFALRTKRQAMKDRWYANRRKIDDKYSTIDVDRPLACYRGNLSQYCHHLFPSFIFSHLDEAAISDYIRQLDICFIEDYIEVEVSSGPNYPSLKLMTKEYICTQSKLLDLDYTTDCWSSDQGSYKKSYAPPLGLISMDMLKQKCIRHIAALNHMIPNQDAYDSGGTSTIVWKALKAIIRYRESEKFTLPIDQMNLLWSAMELYQAICFLNRTVILTEKSTKNVMTSLRVPKIPPDTRKPILIPTLLNLQVKQAMRDIFIDRAAEVLRGLDNILRSAGPGKSSWAVSFCVSSILSMCIEEIQLASDAYISARVSKSRSDHSVDVHAMAVKSEEALNHVWLLFRGAYPIHRKTLSHSSRDNIAAIGKKGITQGEGRLVQDIRDMIKDQEDETSNALPFLSRNNSQPTKCVNFRKRNPGRLIFKALKSLF